MFCLTNMLSVIPTAGDVIWYVSDPTRLFTADCQTLPSWFGNPRWPQDWRTATVGWLLEPSRFVPRHLSRMRATYDGQSAV